MEAKSIRVVYFMHPRIDLATLVNQLKNQTAGKIIAFEKKDSWTLVP